MFCDTRLYVQAVIQLYQSIEQTIHGPDVVLRAGKCRIQGSDGVVLVVSERPAGFGWGRGLVAGKQGDKQRKQEQRAGHGWKVWLKNRLVEAKETVYPERRIQPNARSSLPCYF